MSPPDRSSPVDQPSIFLAHLENDRQQTLKDHLLNVSGAARVNAAKIGIGAAGAAIGLLHDLGKYSQAFQQYLRRMAASDDTEQDPERGKIDHSTAGGQTIWRNLKRQGTQEGIVGEILALCIASHHSGLIDCISPDGQDNLSRRMAKPDLARGAWIESQPAASHRAIVLHS